MPGTDWYRWDGADLVLRLHVQPRASQDAFAGRHGDALKLRITAPPLDGRANAHLTGFLAQAFGVAKSQVSVLQGGSARAKLVRVIHPRRLPPELDITPAP